MEAVNNLLRSVGDDNHLGLNPDVMGPIFNKTIDHLHEKGMDLHAPTIWINTTLRLVDKLREKRKKMTWEPFFIESTYLESMLGISTYLNAHPDTEKSFKQIEALKHLPHKGVDY